MHRNQIELWGIKSTSGNFRSYQIQTGFFPFKIFQIFQSTERPTRLEFEGANDKQTEISLSSQGDKVTTTPTLYNSPFIQVHSSAQMTPSTYECPNGYDNKHTPSRLHT